MWGRRWVFAVASVAGCGAATEVTPGGDGTSDGTSTQSTTASGGTTASTTQTATSASTTDPSSTTAPSSSTTDPTGEPTSGSSSASTTAAGTGTTGPGATEFRRPITIPQGAVAGDLTDFVVLVTSAGEDSLRFVDNGGNVAVMNGSDLAFRDAGGTPLPWELVAYRAASGAFVAWVQVPLVTAGNDTTFYLHYGDENAVLTPANPWTNYLAVYHLEDTLANDTVTDSGMFNVVGQAFDLNAQDSVAGKIGRGFRFQNDNDVVRITSATLDGQESMTVLAWARMDGAGSSFPRIWHKGSSGPRRVELFVEDANANLGELIWRINEAQPSDVELNVFPASFAVGTFHHYVGVADNENNEARVYFDGVEAASSSWTPPIDNGFVNSYIGNWETAPNGNRYWNGVIDEVHVYDAAGTDDWVGAKHRNMDDPTAFAVVGAEEAL